MSDDSGKEEIDVDFRGMIVFLNKELFMMEETDIISLNVGGCLYTTSRATLTTFPESMLGAMFAGNMPSKQDKDGNTFIDRDGPAFRYILNFCRSGQLLLPDDFKDINMLQEEADFYQIQPLIQSIKKIKQEKNASHKWHYIEIEELRSSRIKLEHVKKPDDFDDDYDDYICQRLNVRGIEQDLRATFGSSFFNLGKINRHGNYARLCITDVEYIDTRADFEIKLCSDGWEIVTSDFPYYKYSHLQHGYKYIKRCKCIRWKKLFLA